VRGTGKNAECGPRLESPGRWYVGTGEALSSLVDWGGRAKQDGRISVRLSGVTECSIVLQLSGSEAQGFDGIYEDAARRTTHRTVYIVHCTLYTVHAVLVGARSTRSDARWGEPLDVFQKPPLSKFVEWDAAGRR
jgi:hypothetical protein